MNRKELLIAPVGEGALVLVVAFAAYASHQPLIFASLGPTAYELVETPHRPSARAYNIIAGHLIAVAAAFAALALTHARMAPPVTSSVTLPRVWAAVVSAILTVLFTLLARATQPAALSTTLLISLGTMQPYPDAAIILLGVVLITLIGAPFRRWRVRSKPPS